MFNTTVFLIINLIFGVEVLCLSVKGLRSHMMNSHLEAGVGFLDPMGRIRHDSETGPRSTVTLDEDYIMFFVFGTF